MTGADPTTERLDRRHVSELEDDSVDDPMGEELAERALGPVGAAVLGAIDAVEILGDVDPAALDAESLGLLAEGIERVRRLVEAAAAVAADHIEVGRPFENEGHFGARSWMRHRLQLSSPEAYRRMQVARMYRRLPAWREAASVGGVGVAQGELMSRVAANPRIEDARLALDEQRLLHDAQTLPFDEFERRVRTWEALADSTGDDQRAQRQRDVRDVRLRPRREGGWTLTGSLDELSGAELNEMFAHFIDAEWRNDWREAQMRLGDDATVTVADLCRTAAQRRADAFVAMARAAASSSPGIRPPRATVNVLFDAASLEATITGATIEPSGYRDVVCRTQRGRRINVREAANVAMVGHIRRVVLDSDGTVIDLGRRSRLFRGGAREAVQLMATECVWLGCEAPVEWCDIDHSVGWAAHGATVPRNGAPLCRRHNLHKERGYQVQRDSDGCWHFIDPYGAEIT